MSLELKYYEPVVNRNGYVLMFPMVADNDELLKVQNPPNPYAESAYQQFPLGTKLVNGERVWRYTKNAAVALNIGAPIQQAKPVHAEQDDDIAVGAIFAIGATVISVTSTANLAAAPWSTKDGGAEGYIYFNVAAGLGQCYKIKGHDAFSGTSEIPITLYDPLTIALTASSKAGLVQNPYANVLATEAVVSGVCVGVPGIDVTASYYFWSQTGGPAAVACNTTIALGTYAVVGTTAAKADPSAAVTTELPIGIMITPGVTGGADHALIFLTLDR